MPSPGVLSSSFDNSLDGTVDSNGELVIEIRATQSYMVWIIGQITAEMPDAPPGAICALRRRGALVTPMIATGDAAGGDPPIILRPGESVTVEWSGATTGDVGTVYWMYDQIDPRGIG